MAAKMLPLMEVSGDFYEVIQVNDRVIATAVIDVSGHGIPAALLTSMIKSEIEIQIKKHTRTHDICSATNLSLYPVLAETGFYFTMFLCLLDLKTMVMEFTNCGHTEPLLFSDGKFMKLNSDGFFIGMSPESQYGSRRIQLKQGDRVFLYTDGVTEARDTANEEYGDMRFMKTITKTNFLPVNEQVNAILSSVDTFRDKSAMSKKDDITLLVFETGTELA
jgi:serine phosphatase RsbU (regulator of sigma subunit)